MPAFTDTHCHLSLDPMWSDLEGVLARSREAGVRRIIAAAYDRESWPKVEKAAQHDGVYAAYGVHPWVADPGEGLGELSDWLERPGVVALGEIGLDFKIDNADRKRQIEVFVRQLELAKAHELPVLLHCRGAFEEMLEILSDHPDVTGVVHAFTRGPQLAARFLDQGLYLAFGGAITRARAKRPKRSAETTPIDKILLETDAPSIGIEGVMPEQVEPKHVADIARALADIRGADYETISEATETNAERLFRFK